jgi:hypothetical protein
MIGGVSVSQACIIPDLRRCIIMWLGMEMILDLWIKLKNLLLPATRNRAFAA